METTETDVWNSFFSSLPVEKDLHIIDPDRLTRMRSLFCKVVEVFGDPEAARIWISSPLSMCGGLTPLQYACSEEGFREIEALLSRLAPSVIS